jgi:hypothetical protein
MFSTLGAATESSVSREEINRSIPGLKNPIKSDAEACTPGVLVKTSTKRPKRKERNKSSARGVSKGNRMMNKI